MVTVDLFVPFRLMLVVISGGCSGDVQHYESRMTYQGFWKSGCDGCMGGIKVFWEGG